ncbi:MAG: energy-coupling factor transporter ATPase [Clostridia bacterium]|nr:energy-coupling factor transporter ATPase [Clostridia bacterium]
MKDAIFEVNNVSFSYEEANEKAMDQVSLSVPEGAFYAVLGQNGSGKSTLAKLLNGLYLPTSGQVLVCGMDTADEKNTWDIRQNAGMVFQNPDNQIVATIVEDDVAFGLENIGVAPTQMPGRIEQALLDVGMLEFRERAPHTLSGGQKQRIAIAGILAMEPRAIIFDEATAMLDPQGRKEVFAAVQKLNREKGITVLWITHFMEEAAQCQHVYIMEDGRIVMEGAPEEVFSLPEKMQALRLDAPAAARLAHRLREAGMPLKAGLLHMEETAKEVARACKLNSKA